MGYKLEIIGNVKRLKKVDKFPEFSEFEIAMIKDAEYNRAENIFTQKQRTVIRADGREIEKGDSVRVIFEKDRGDGRPYLYDIVGQIDEIAVLNSGSAINGAFVFRDKKCPDKKVNVMFSRIKYITLI